MRVWIYQGRSLALTLFGTCALLQVGLWLLLGAFLLLRWPLLGRLPAGEALGFLFVEVGPTSLALALPLALGLHLQNLRQTGELRALWTLRLGPIRSRQGFLIALLPFVLLYGFWAVEVAPRNRARLERSLGNPLLLLAGGRYEELDRAASSLGGVALAYESAGPDALHRVTLLERKGEQWQALTAEALELADPHRLRLQNGRFWSARASPVKEMRFERLDLDILGDPLAAPWDPTALVLRAWRTTCALIVSLLVVLLLLGRKNAPPRAARLVAWLLPPLLFWLGASS